MLNLKRIRKIYLDNVYNKYLCLAYYVDKQYNNFFIRESFLQKFFVESLIINPFIDEEIELINITDIKNITITNNYYVTTLNNSFKFKKLVASTTWTINHNLGYYPSEPLITDLENNNLSGIVNNTTINQTVITFQDVQSGYAYFS